MRLWILIALILSLILSGYCELDRIDLNTATYDQIKNLPISAEQAEAIWEWRLYLGAFNSVYDLLRVQGIDFATFERLKPLVAISPVILEESAQRLEDNYYKVEQWMTDEGANENLVADWIIRLSEPVNINTIRFFELINLAGVSPVDAVAIVNRQKSGPILNRNDLRSTDNLSYYGFSNLEDFICYDQPAKAKRLGGSFSAIWKNITLSQTPSDDAESYEQFKARDYPLDAFYRLRLNYGLDYRAEISYLQNLGEPTLYISRNLKIPQFKGFLEIRNKKLGPLKINNLVVGNYTAAFGQGLVLETNDYFIPRKTGYGWRKRFIGLSGDIWFELGKNLLILQACLLPPVKAIYWLQILMELVTLNTLTFYLIALYSDLAAKKPLLQAQALLEKLQPWLTKQSEQIVNLGALFVTPLRLLENLFAELVSWLPQLEAIIATYHSQIHCNRTFQDACRRIPILVPEQDQLSVPKKEYKVEHLFYERLLNLRHSYSNLRQACQDFALAPEDRFYQPLFLKTAKKIELTTPWGKMPVELKLHSRAKTASLTIVHPEPYRRKLLIAWSKGLSFEELPLIINALEIIPDRHEL